MTYAEEREEWERKQQTFWKKHESTSEYQVYHQFWKEYCLKERKPTDVTKIPLIGVKDAKNPFEINRYYHKPFFLFEPDTPPMKKTSIDKAIEEDLRFMGQIPNICWGITRTPGHSLDTYTYYGADELFMAFERFFKKKLEKIPPKYFGLEVCGSRPYGDNPCNWEFAVNSFLYILTLFGERK